MCMGCGIRYGALLDHDHRTGLVRGLLCRHCNQRADVCLHVDGCPWADYQNRPPLLAWREMHPTHRETMRLPITRRRMKLLADAGIDIAADVDITSPIPGFGLDPRQHDTERHDGWLRRMTELAASVDDRGDDGRGP